MTSSSTVPTHRPVTAWAAMLTGRTTHAIAEIILEDLVGYNRRSPRRGRDADNLAAALDAIIQLHEAAKLIKRT